MKKSIMLLALFTCACSFLQAQVNFVRNPGLEQYSKCPDYLNEIHYANGWRNATDSVMVYGMEYYDTCGNSFLDHVCHIPDNSGFYQYPHSGYGMAGMHLYFDKSITPPAPLPFNYRDYLQSHLIKNLEAGKTYCVSFWVNLSESAGYSQNKIGAYFDNGKINTIADTAGEEITTVIPQIYTNTILSDTEKWEKIEGTFIAAGNETYITIGNFFKNSVISTIVMHNWNNYPTASYYLLDDVSVIPIDLSADAGKDAWVEKGKKVQIGRVGDTTAQGLDCKWYYRGNLVDSGAIISVNASSIVGATDTYAVVQTICGLVKKDTVLVRTVGTGISLPGGDRLKFQVYPNPSDGHFTLHFSDPSFVGMTKAVIKVYDLMGRCIHQQTITEKETQIKLNAAKGIYMLEFNDEDGNFYRERLIIQ